VSDASNLTKQGAEGKMEDVKTIALKFDGDGTVSDQAEAILILGDHAIIEHENENEVHCLSCKCASMMELESEARRLKSCIDDAVKLAEVRFRRIGKQGR
jgi:hypothetical protein